MTTIRIGIVGLGDNTRHRHVPGLRACDDVEITAVCNRRPESTRRAAEEFGIAKTYAEWQALVADPDLDAVLIGTWPYLHCEVTLAALAAGKHVMTEARMAMDADQARQMHEASLRHSNLVTQIVPSPLGLRAHRVVEQMLADDYIGELREVTVLGIGNQFSDPATPLHWRQQSRYSGLNMLALGILHETLIRWTPDPQRVTARTQTFTTKRIDPETGELADVTSPDSVHASAELPGGARVLYHLSGVMHHGPALQIQLYGERGTLKYQFAPQDRLLAGRAGEDSLREIQVPQDQQGGWRVEADFIDAIRGRKTIEFTDFATGVRYMNFTQAVADSAARGEPVSVAAVRDESAGDP